MSEQPDWAFRPENHTATEADPNHIVGMTDFGARMAIRDMFKVHCAMDGSEKGFQDARELVAMYVNEIAERRR